MIDWYMEQERDREAHEDEMIELRRARQEPNIQPICFHGDSEGTVDTVRRAFIDTLTEPNADYAQLELRLLGMEPRGGEAGE